MVTKLKDVGRLHPGLYGGFTASIYNYYATKFARNWNNTRTWCADYLDATLPVPDTQWEFDICFFTTNVANHATSTVSFTAVADPGFPLFYDLSIGNSHMRCCHFSNSSGLSPKPLCHLNISKNSSHDLAFYALVYNCHSLPTYGQAMVDTVFIISEFSNLIFFIACDMMRGPRSRLYWGTNFLHRHSLEKIVCPT